MLSAVFVGQPSTQAVFFGSDTVESVFIGGNDTKAIFGNTGSQGPSGPPGGALPIIASSDDTVMAANSGYAANDPDDPVIFNFPLTPATGNICAIYGYGAGGWMLALRSGEIVEITCGTNSTSGPSGSINSVNKYDSATFVFMVDRWIATLNGCSFT